MGVNAETHTVTNIYFQVVMPIALLCVSASVCLRLCVCASVHTNSTIRQEVGNSNIYYQF